jgi:hypothetical protein
MELTGGADCGALEGDEKSEQVEEEVASGGSVRVERLVRHCGLAQGIHFNTLNNYHFLCRWSFNLGRHVV